MLKGPWREGRPREEMGPAARLSEAEIARVRERIDIVDWIGAHVRLEQSGKTYKGLCPFHQEKTPSFHVNPQKQLYHCFGCHAGGDVITFTMQVEGLSFPEALQRLADQAGVRLTATVASPEAAKRQRLLDAALAANRAAAEWFAACLRSPIGEAARAYAAGRGIEPETTARFGLGYAPPGWDGLIAALQRRGIPLDAALTAGLVVRKERGGAYDRFRRRLMFPIREGSGRVIGFGGRSLGPDDQPKYLNSQESAVFSKRRTLFALDLAADAIRREGRALVVEGYLDAITLHQAGFTWAVGSLGTAFTPEQAKKLRRLADTVLLAFDADAAGQAASLRGLDVLAEAGLEVAVVTLPAGDDPDAFVRREGAAGWQELLAQALPLAEYRLIQSLRGIDLASVEGRTRGVKAVLPVLAGIDSPTRREGYLQRAAARLGVSEAALGQELVAYGAGRGRAAVRRPVVRERGFPVRNGSPGGTKGRDRHSFASDGYTIRDLRPDDAPVAAAADNALPPAEQVERALLRLVLDDPPLARAVAAALGPEPFATDPYNRLLQGLSDHPEMGVPGDPELARLAGALAVEPSVAASFESCLERAREGAVRRALSRLDAELYAAERLSPPERLAELARLAAGLQHVSRQARG